jgi:hypothetical protein
MFQAIRMQSWHTKVIRGHNIDDLGSVFTQSRHGNLINHILANTRKKLRGIDIEKISDLDTRNESAVATFLKSTEKRKGLDTRDLKKDFFGNNFFRHERPETNVQLGIPLGTGNATFDGKNEGIVQVTKQDVCIDLERPLLHFPNEALIRQKGQFGRIQETPIGHGDLHKSLDFFLVVGQVHHGCA